MRFGMIIKASIQVYLRNIGIARFNGNHIAPHNKRRAAYFIIVKSACIYISVLLIGRSGIAPYHLVAVFIGYIYILRNFYNGSIRKVFPAAVYFIRIAKWNIKSFVAAVILPAI